MKENRNMCYTFGILLTFMLGLLIINTPLVQEGNKESKITNIKSSAPLGYTIHIDNNWTLTNTTYSWCNGSGTEEFPFIIRDIEIDANLGTGILIGNSTEYFEIINVNVYNANTTSGYAGIYFDNVQNGKIYGSDISNNGYRGIHLDGCSDITIEYNTIEDNTWDGILLTSGTTSCEIDSNYIVNNGYSGIYLEGNSNNNEIHNNTISNIASSLQNYGVYSTSCDFGKFYNNTIEKNTNHGLYQVTSDDSNITKNIIKENGAGIYGLICLNMDVIDNDILSNNGNGMTISACSNIQIINNTIYDSNGDGISIVQNTDNGEIIGNVIQDNSNYGFIISNENDDNNLVYLNSFSGNGIHVKDNGTTTAWDNGVMGNYWDNYTGSDSNLDGIGETPKPCLPNGIDNYPIMVSNTSLLFDNDGDGLSDYQELDGGLNPFSNIPTNPYNADTDNDGLNDGEEIDGSANTFDGDPTNPNQADSDSDDLNDFEEVNTFNTDPNDADTDKDGFNDGLEVSLLHNPLNILNYPKSDLIISSYEVSNLSLTIVIQNNGTWNSENIIVVIRISSVFLVLYNNSDEPFDLSVGQKKTIIIEFADYADSLAKGDSYIVTVSIDPDNLIDELDETNNYLGGLEFTHVFGLNMEDVRMILLIVGISIAVVSVGIAMIVLSKKKKALKNYKPRQIMVIQKEGSLMLYNYIFPADLPTDRNENALEPKEKSIKHKRSDEEIAKIEEKTSKLEELNEKKESKGVDELLAAGAFSGIQSLLSNILQTEKGLNEISHGDLTIYFNYGAYGIFIYIVNGRSPECLKKLKKFSDTFEDSFGEHMKNFSGEVGIFKSADAFVKLIILD